MKAAIFILFSCFVIGCHSTMNITILAKANIITTTNLPSIKFTTKRSNSTVIHQDMPKICNKEYFMENYVMKGIYIDLGYMNKMCSPYYKNCTDSPAYLMYFSLVEYTKGDDERYVIQIGLENITKMRYQDCWMHVMTSTSKNVNEIDYFFYNHTKVSDKRIVEYSYTPSTEYKFEIAMLPTGRPYIFNVTTPGRCEMEMLYEIHRKLEKLNRIKLCLSKLTYEMRIKFSRKLCKKYKEDIDSRRNIVKDRLTIRKNCTLTLQAPHVKDEPIDVKTKVLIISLAVLFVAFVSTICRFVAIKRKEIKYRRRNLQEKVLNKEVLQNEEAPSVMILNRPGCELLEGFLRDLAFILRSYGITVKLTLLERSQLDAEGGIASYMQRYIDTCDYILIMFNESTQEDKPVLKHRPYEFALRVIGGLAFHQNNCSRYLPMYLTPYKDAVHLLPSFLHASTTFGYQVPNEIEKLICCILKTDVLEVTKERTVKNKFFVNRMKEFRRKLLQTRHENCSRENCYKGTAYTSVTNLSSIWPSTVHSKWASVKSIDQSEALKHLIPIGADAECLNQSNAFIDKQPFKNMIQAFTSITNNHISVTQFINNNIHSKSEDNLYNMTDREVEEPFNRNDNDFPDFLASSNLLGSDTDHSV